MLEWMQRHKKWLIVTIWISVIALVSAGMVGWNPSSFSLSGDQVAKVGKIKISQQEFINAYQRVFNEYNQMLGGNLDQLEAKKFGLDKLALNQLVQRAQLQSLAKDLGLRVEDSEVVDTITKDSNFQRDGRFDDELYRQLLRDNHLSVKFFEESVRDSLLVDKLIKLLPISISSLETWSMGSTIALSDTITYQILKPEAPKTTITQAMLKDHWEKHKSNYMQKPRIELASISIPISTQKFNNEDLLSLYNEDKTLYLDDQGQLKSFDEVKTKVQHDFQAQQAKKEAMRLSNQLRDNSKDGKNLLVVLDNNAPEELVAQFNDLTNGQITKPFLYKDHYVIGKVIKKTPEQPKSYEEAKNQVLAELKTELSLNELKTKAEKSLPLSKGSSTKINNIGNPKIATLNAQETQFVIRNIFSNNQKSGVIMLDSGAFVYTITHQELPSQVPVQTQGLIQNIKSQVIDSALMSYLNEQYPPKYYLQNLELGVEIGQ